MPDVSLAALGLRLAISMGVVIALMFLAAKLLRRAQAYAVNSGTKGRKSGKVTRIPIAVTTIAPLTKGASVAIVRAAGREMVLGVTEQQVTLLHSALETRDALEVGEPRETRVNLDIEDLHTSAVTAEDGLIDLDRLEATTSTRSTGAARIAALVPTLTPDTGDADGSSAWTDALETLRAKTVRR